MLSATAWAGNWNKKTTLESNGRIPKKASPSLTDLRDAYSIYYQGDLRKHPQHSVTPSKNPYQFTFSLKKNEKLDKSLQHSGLFSYLLFENNRIVLDEISPKDRLGNLIFKNSKFNSQSAGKSIVSYVLGHAICAGVITDISANLNDWPLVLDTLYANQSLQDLVNMNAGDSKFIKRRHARINGATVKFFDQTAENTMRLLKGTASQKSSGSSFYYSNFVPILVNNYIAFKSGEKYSKILDEAFQKKAGIAQEVSFVKSSYASPNYEGTATGVLRYTFFANRYDYLRIAKAMLDDWQNDTCVGKYLKNLYRNKISKKANGKSPYSSSRSYAGFFHTDFIGVKGTVFGMNGYGGQNIFINFDSGKIVVAHAVHQNYNWRTLVLQAVSSN